MGERGIESVIVQLSAVSFQQNYESKIALSAGLLMQGPP